MLALMESFEQTELPLAWHYPAFALAPAYQADLSGREMLSTSPPRDDNPFHDWVGWKGREKGSAITISQELEVECCSKIFAFRSQLGYRSCMVVASMVPKVSREIDGGFLTTIF